MFTFFYKFFTRSILVLIVSMLSVNYLPEQLFSDFDFDPKSVEPVNYDSVIPQQWNTKLSDNNPEFIQLNQILGPESLAIASNGLIYTGLADGRIIELDSNKQYKMRTVLRFKQSLNCKDNLATRASECGRFLQMRLLNDTSLFSLESNTGLYKIDTKSGSKTLIGPKTLNKINLFNSFAFDPKDSNMVYMTISSTKWDLQKIVWSFMELETSGQLIAFDIATGKWTIVLDKLSMPNGIDVDAKHNRLLFSETIRGRISSVDLDSIRVAFKGAKSGDRLSNVQKSVLIPVVPGLPDNIVVNKNIAYIALPFVKPKGKELVDHLSSMPQVRKSLARFQFGIGKLLEYVCQNFYHHPLLESVYREFVTGHLVYRVMQTDQSAVLEYDLSSGSSRLLGSNTFGFLSEATPDSKGNLYLGSFRSPFLVKVKV